MNKYKHGKQFGFAYKVNGLCLHSIPILRKIPYLTGNKVKLKISLKSLFENQEYTQGRLTYEPPIFLNSEFANDEVFREYEISGDVFNLDESQIFKQKTNIQFTKDKWRSIVRPLKAGDVFVQPYSFKVYFELERIGENDSTESCKIELAYIEIISDTKFWAWIIPSVIALGGLIIATIKIVN